MSLMDADENGDINDSLEKKVCSASTCMYHFWTQGGCGKTQVKLSLQEDTSQFSLDFESHWMSSERKVLKLQGQVQRKSDTFFGFRG